MHLLTLNRLSNSLDINLCTLFLYYLENWQIMREILFIYSVCLCMTESILKILFTVSF